MNLNNTEIVKELSLPPVKIHCSVLAEDAIKAAIKDYRQKQGNAVFKEYKEEVGNDLGSPITGR